MSTPPLKPAGQDAASAFALSKLSEDKRAAFYAGWQALADGLMVAAETFKTTTTTVGRT